MSPSQCKAARALLKIEQDELSKLAGVARSTIIDFERETRIPRQATVAAICAALRAAGIEFIAENGGGAGVRLRNKE